MNRNPLTVVQVSTYESAGGAERVARNLFEAYRQLGHRSYLVAGRGPSTDGDIVALEDGQSRIAHALSGPGRLLDRWRGLESYRYPASRGLPDIVGRTPDIVHLHNLHGGYFDLRTLPGLSQRFPTVITLHDAWLLSGHCAHSFDCERWRSGCGHCPDLTIYPAIRRDATAANWRRKRDVFERSALHIATPSVWLMDRVRDSMLAPAIRTARVIPNGVDLSVFSPDDAREARSRSGLPPDRHVVVVSGNAPRTNPFRDWPMVRRAVSRAAAMLDEDIVLVVLDDNGESGHADGVELRPVPFESDPSRLADYYRAADVHIHAARADTFPNTVIEALACGTPVVATAVGGIVEQVRTLVAAHGSPGSIEAHDAGAATGVLVPAGDAAAMGDALARVLKDRELRRRLATNAVEDARRRFDFARQRDAYIEWYVALLEARSPRLQSGAGSASGGPPARES